MKLTVKKEVLFAADPHYDIWAMNPSYTSNSGESMVLSRHVTNTRGLGVENWPQWEGSVQKHISNDNGKTWTPQGEKFKNGSFIAGKVMHGDWQFFMDSSKNALIAVYNQSKIQHASKDNSVWEHRENRFFYEISHDGGKSWTAPRQIIHPGNQYNKDHWMPNITAGIYKACADQTQFVRLDDGTILMGVHIHREPIHPNVCSVFFRAQWSSNGDELIWTCGEELQIPESDPYHSCELGEPDLLLLENGRLVTTLRCRGNRKSKLPARRWICTSDDGGLTWTTPRQLTYTDGSPVYVPGCLARFVSVPEIGKHYWITNILPEPTYGCDPRYPLTIAEFDPQKLGIVKNSVTVIQDLPPGAPRCEDFSHGTGRRYSNFGIYRDRVTGEIVLLLAEEPKISWDDGTADCYRYRLRFM